MSPTSLFLLPCIIPRFHYCNMTKSCHKSIDLIFFVAFFHPKFSSLSYLIIFPSPPHLLQIPRGVSRCAIRRCFAAGRFAPWLPRQLLPRPSQTPLGEQTSFCSFFLKSDKTKLSDFLGTPLFFEATNNKIPKKNTITKKISVILIAEEHSEEQPGLSNFAVPGVFSKGCS